jgi:hypothetical protein
MISKSLAVFVVLLIVAMMLTACSSGGDIITTNTTIPPTTKATTAPPTSATVEPTTSTAPATTAAWDGVPVISLVNVDTIAYTSAMFTGAIEKGEGIDQQGFEWGTSPGSYTFNHIEKGEFSAGTFNRLVTTLTEGTTYYYRCKAHNSKGWGTSEEKSFRTLGGPKITAVNANYAFVGDTLTVIVSGSYFTGATSLIMGDGITVKSFTVKSDTTISADIQIAADAGLGPRTITIVTELGTGTLAAGFIVQQEKMVLHSFRWNDAKFNEIMHLLTATTEHEHNYDLRYYDNNQIFYMADARVYFGVEVRGGKLCFTNMSENIWHVFSSGAPYLSYNADTKVMTFESLPDSVLQTDLDMPVTAWPSLNSAETYYDSGITLTYYVFEVVSQ